jgi:hypothetical protein
VRARLWCTMQCRAHCSGCGVATACITGRRLRPHLPRSRR